LHSAAQIKRFYFDLDPQTGKMVKKKLSDQVRERVQ
jgi:hypothetical protein